MSVVWGSALLTILANYFDLSKKTFEIGLEIAGRTNEAM
jgi:hypothetical protein